MKHRIPSYYHAKDFSATDPETTAVFPLKHARGFSLVEMLVAVTVLLFLMIVVALVVTDTQKVSTASDKSLGADGEARTVFDRMAMDIARMVKRPDVDYLLNHSVGTTTGGNDSFFFYSEAPAFPTASATIQQQNSVALAGYRINPKFQLERLGKGLTWSATPSDGMVFLTYASYPLTASSTPVSGSTLTGAFPTVVSATSTDANYHVIGPDVFRFEFCYLLNVYTNTSGVRQPAAYSNVPWNSTHQYAMNSTTVARTDLTGIGLSDVQAIVVCIAILDATSRKGLPTGATLSTASGLFADPSNADLAAAPPKLMATTWQNYINSGSFAAGAAIPKPAANQVRIFQRVFPLYNQ